MYRDDALSVLDFPIQLSLPALTLPAHYHRSNWPTALRIAAIYTIPDKNYATVLKKDGSMLSPVVPLSQLSSFLNHHVEGSAVCTLDIVAECGQGKLLLRLLNEVLPQKFNFEGITMDRFFHRLLPWTTAVRIFNSEQMMRTKSLSFRSLRLPPDVDPRMFLMGLSAVRECNRLSIHDPYAHDGVVVPQFPSAAVIEWLNSKEAEEECAVLDLSQGYFAEGVLEFVSLLKKDFVKATLRHKYHVRIICPDIDTRLMNCGGLLFNPATGEELSVKVGEDPEAVALVGGRRSLNSVTVWRLLRRR